MDSESNQPIIDEVYRQIEGLVKQAGTTSDRILSFAKVRISANDRIAFLASGILTLTFSGAVSFATRPGFHFSVDALRPLLWAWKLLIFAIICCIVANSREGRAASLHDDDLLAHELWARTKIVKLLALKLNPAKEQLPDAMPQSKPQGRVHQAIAEIFGWLARVSTVVAFVLMYRFVRSLILQ